MRRDARRFVATREDALVKWRGLVWDMVTEKVPA